MLVLICFVIRSIHKFFCNYVFKSTFWFETNSPLLLGLLSSIIFLNSFLKCSYRVSWMIVYTIKFLKFWILRVSSYLPLILLLVSCIEPRDLNNFSKLHFGGFLFDDCKYKTFMKKMMELTNQEGGRGDEFVLKTNRNKIVFEKLLHPRIVSQTFCLKPISNQSPTHNILLLKHFKKKYL